MWQGQKAHSNYLMFKNITVKTMDNEVLRQAQWADKKLFWIVWNVLWGEKSSFSSRFFSQIAPLSSLEEAVETEVFHSQTFKQTIQNSFLIYTNTQKHRISILRTIRITSGMLWQAFWTARLYGTMRMAVWSKRRHLETEGHSALWMVAAMPVSSQIGRASCRERV